MADTFSWNVANMERQLADGTVFTVHYTVTAERTANNGDVYTAGAYGSIGLDTSDKENFIPYDQLTEEIVIGWTKEKLGEETVANMQASLSANLDQQQTPTQAAGVPW